jgi:hypothetical protein
MNTLAQGIPQETVQRMAPVVANIFTQKAGAYADGNISHKLALI